MAEQKSTGTEAQIKGRVERGVLLAAIGAVKPLDGERYSVQGSRPMPYTVDLERECCTCPDHQHRGQTCKHIYAAEIVAARRNCRRRARRRIVRHDSGDSLRGITASLDGLNRVADRLGV